MKNRYSGLIAVFTVFACASQTSFATEQPSGCTAEEANQAVIIIQQFSTTCLDGVAGGVSTLDSTRVVTNNLSTNTSSHESNESTAFFGESNLKGLAAGNTLQGWGFWGTFNYINYDGDNNLAPNTTTLVPKVIYDADTKSFMGGADRLFNDRLVLGVAVGYEDTSVLTFFNGGNNDTDGFTVAPYMAYLINDKFSVDAAVGYSALQNDTDRLELGTASTLRASFDSDRWFFSTNLNVADTYNNWYLSGRVGYLYTHESQDGYTETGSTGGAGNRTVGERNVHISQIIVGGEASYNFGRQEPYFGIAYVNDLHRNFGFGAGGLPGGVTPLFDDDDEFQLNGGLRLYADQFTAILDLSHVVSRNNFDSYSVMFTIRTDL